MIALTKVRRSFDVWFHQSLVGGYVGLFGGVILCVYEVGKLMLTGKLSDEFL